MLSPRGYPARFVFPHESANSKLKSMDITEIRSGMHWPILPHSLDSSARVERMGHDSDLSSDPDTSAVLLSKQVMKKPECRSADHRAVLPLYLSIVAFTTMK